MDIREIKERMNRLPRRDLIAIRKHASLILHYESVGRKVSKGIWSASQRSNGTLSKAVNEQIKMVRG